MNPGAVFISFDAVAVSGITVEALKVAKRLRRNDITCYLDVGYDIKVDKGNFNKPYDYEKAIYQGVFSLVRVEDLESVPHYNVPFITHSHEVLIGQKVTVTPEEKVQLLNAIDASSEVLAQRIIQLWESLNIRYVIVENGTLPENIIYTKALYRAIEIYGAEHALGKFVIWRDHDLMWNSEQAVMKYGPEPYCHAVKPVPSAHITYVTLNNHLKNRLEQWCDHQVRVEVRKNTYDFARPDTFSNIREALDIRDTDLLIARTTRIIPQKRQDRDIWLVHHLNRLFSERGSPRKVYLAIAGDPDEHPACFEALVRLAQELQVEPFIKFLGSLSHDCMPSREHAITIEDLYGSCDLVSFLTSWGYDSYGNPIGEAISC